ncbi:MAG: ribulose-phosphate 3-epimerase, partial [Bacteroidota bacterium]|nr:ribulose-phosphate 3-epimerase [Bacteroidota bacterium]
MTKTSISILNCDFNNIDNEIKRINNSSADYIHLDIMDGDFVKNNTSELFNLEKISSLSKKKLDIHLMVQKPNEIIDLYCLPTTEIISIHYES